MSEHSKRVLIVGMLDSVHLARWVSQFDPSEYSFLIFPSTPNRKIHPKLQDLVTTSKTIRVEPFAGKFSVLIWVFDIAFGGRLRAWLLCQSIRKFKPHVLHAVEFQHAGYLADKALNRLPFQGQLVLTNYGSDIYWFQRFPRHLSKIKSLLSKADRYLAECQRDVDLARQFGFEGTALEVMPNSGGFTVEQMERNVIKTSDRRTILVKGYEGWAGRSHLVADSLKKIDNRLKSYEIVFYSCSALTRLYLRMLRRKSELNLRWYGKNELTHEEMLEMFGSARIYIGASVTDGISTSMLEAMAMGAFPIQTNTACTSEWLKNGINGLEIRELDALNISELVCEVLEDVDRLDEARMHNREISHKRLLWSQLSLKAQNAYL